MTTTTTTTTPDLAHQILCDLTEIEATLSACLGRFEPGSSPALLTAAALDELVGIIGTQDDLGLRLGDERRPAVLDAHVHAQQCDLDRVQQIVRLAAGCVDDDESGELLAVAESAERVSNGPDSLALLLVACQN